MADYEKWDKRSIDKLLKGIYKEECRFCIDITNEMTDKELEEYLEEFPEFRKYYCKDN